MLEVASGGPERLLAFVRVMATSSVTNAIHSRNANFAGIITGGCFQSFELRKAHPFSHPSGMI